MIRPPGTMTRPRFSLLNAGSAGVKFGSGETGTSAIGTPGDRPKKPKGFRFPASGSLPARNPRSARERFRAPLLLTLPPAHMIAMPFHRLKTLALATPAMLGLTTSALLWLTAPAFLALTAPAWAIDGGYVAGRNALSRATVAIGTLGSGEGGGIARCSGVLIGPRTVLTAGHCVANNPRAAVVILYDGARPTGRPIPVTEVLRYAGNPSDLPAEYATLRTLALDSARLTLASPVRDRAPVRVGQGTAPNRLKLAGTGLSPEGVGTLKTTPLTPVLRTRNGLIVAETRGASVCSGDSGGPVVADGPGGPTVWGVASAVLTNSPPCGNLLLVAPARPR